MDNSNDKTLNQLAALYPNDLDLGRAVRAYVNSKPSIETMVITGKMAAVDFLNDDGVTTITITTQK